jgi:hypothetical protein
MKNNTYIAVIVSLGLMYVEPSLSATNPLSNITNTDGVAYTDQVVSLDWDLSANIVNGTATLDRAYVEAIINTAADRLYTATEGMVRLGKVTVYDKGQYLDNTDHTILNKPGRANAHVNGYMKWRGARDQLFIESNYGNGTSYVNTPEKIGATMVHEMGHYVFGLYDEYREVGRLTGSPSQPQDGDTPRNTLMHNQNLWTNFSRPCKIKNPI